MQKDFLLKSKVFCMGPKNEPGTPGPLKGVVLRFMGPYMPRFHFMATQNSHKI